MENNTATEIEKIIHRLMEQEIYDLDHASPESFFEFCKIMYVAHEYTKYDLIRDLMNLLEKTKNGH
jgi:hypothetical protein